VNYSVNYSLCPVFKYNTISFGGAGTNDAVDDANADHTGCA